MKLYKQPKQATTTPEASKPYRWVLDDSNDFSSVETIAYFTYDENNRLKTVKGKLDNGIRYSYDSVGKVNMIEEYNGEKISSSLEITYHFHETRFKTFRNENYLYVFDNYGHTINVVDDKGNITYYFYNNIFEDSERPSNWNMNNKVVGYTVTENISNQEENNGYIESRPNLLTNPGFDIDPKTDTENKWYYQYNNDLHKPSDYYNSDIQFDIVEHNVDIYGIIINGNVMTISGDVNCEKGLSQEITLVDGKAGDSYTIGGLARGFIPYMEKNENAKIGIRVTVENTTDIRSYFFNFNNDVTDGQYLIDSFVTEIDYNKIKFEVVYQGENIVSFDYLQLFRGEIKTEYEYKSEPLNDKDISYRDKTGNVGSINNPNSDGVTTIEYNDTNPYLATDIKDEKDVISKVEYEHINGFNRVGSVSRENIKSSFEYDDYNNVIGTIFGDKLGNYFKTSTTYIKEGLFIDTITDEFNKSTQYDYDVVTGLLDAVIDKNDVRADYTYDEYGRLKTVSKDGSNNTYYYKDGLLDEIEVNGFKYKFNYDDFGKVTDVSIMDINSVEYKKLMSYIYENDINNDSVADYYTDRMLEQIYGNADRIKFEYDSESRITKIYFKHIADTDYRPKYEYIYDTKGRLFKYIDHVNEETLIYRYDNVGRLEKVENGSNSISFKYNKHNEFETYEYNIFGLTRTISYLYNDNGLYNKTIYGNIEKNYNYIAGDALSRIDNITLKTGSNTIKETFKYVDTTKVSEDEIVIVNGNASSRIRTIEYDINSDGIIDLSYSYKYDNVGNIKSIAVDDNGKSEQYDYKYDKLNQLIREDVKISDTIKFTNIYTYDKYGNIISKKSYDYQPGVLEENLKDIKSTYTYTYDDVWKDLLKNFYGKDIEYDNSGNPISIGDNITLTWEGRELVEYNDTSLNLNITYTYNDQGIRTSKTVNGVKTSYYLDGDKVLYESNGTDKIYYTYDIDGKVISINYNGEEYFYIRNIQGDIVKIVDINGKIVVSYTYDAWGNIINTTDTSGKNISSINPYRYRGYRYDSETNLYYLNSRYYNPEMGRFINADGLIGETGDILGHNMYAYCQNNPVMLIDPNGSSPWSWFKKIVKKAAVQTVDTITYACTMLTHPFLPVASSALQTSMDTEPDQTYEVGGRAVNRALRTSKTLNNDIIYIINNNPEDFNLSTSIVFPLREIDLFLAFHKMNMEVRGNYNDRQDEIQIDITLSDPYNYEFWDGYSPAALINNYGYTLQNWGVIVPYQIEINYSVTYIKHANGTWTKK